MTVQVEIRVPCSTLGERLLVRPVFRDGEPAGAEQVVEAGSSATFYAYEGVHLQLHNLARSVPVAELPPLDPLEDDAPGAHLDLRGRADLVPA